MATVTEQDRRKLEKLKFIRDSLKEALEDAFKEKECAKQNAEDKAGRLFEIDQELQDLQ